MQDAKRQISIANSEFKAVSSSMDNWSKSTDGISAKLKQLDANLNSQKTILKSLESQYELVVKEQGEGSAAADKLKIAINNQKATINGTEKEIKKYGESLKTAEKAEEIASKTGKDATKVFDELGNEVEQTADKAKKSSDGFTVMKGALSNLVSDGIRAGINALKNFGTAMVDTAAKADELATQAKVLSIDTTTLQEWEYASDFIDTSVDTMSGALKKLTKNMAGDSKSVTSAFEQLGVSAKDSSGELRSSKDVFFDLIDGLGKVENETERDALAMSLFGKSAMDLNPLIEAGGDELARLSKEAHDVGVVLDGDTIESFNGLQDKLDKLESIKSTVFADFGKELLDSGAVDEFTEF